MYFNELPIPKDIRWRRLLSIALFLGLLYAFRGLTPVLVIFVVFARLFGWASDKLYERTHLKRSHSIAGILALFLGGVGVGVFFFVKRAIDFVNMVRTQGSSYVAADVDTLHGFKAGLPRRLAPFPPGATEGAFSPDRKKSLLVMSSTTGSGKAAQVFDVLANWTSALKKP